MHKSVHPDLVNARGLLEAFDPVNPANWVGWRRILFLNYKSCLPHLTEYSRWESLVRQTWLYLNVERVEP